MDFEWIQPRYDFQKTCEPNQRPSEPNQRPCEPNSSQILASRYGSRYGFILKWVWIQGADSTRAIMRYGFRVCIYESFTDVSCRYGSRYGFSLKWVWIQGADSMRALMRYGFRVWIYLSQVWISVKRHTIFIKRYGLGSRLDKFNIPYNSESAIQIQMYMRRK